MDIRQVDVRQVDSGQQTSGQWTGGQTIPTSFVEGEGLAVSERSELLGLRVGGDNSGRGFNRQCINMLGCTVHNAK